MVYAIICDGEFDQFCDDKAIANREILELQAMGFTVTTKKFQSWIDAEFWVDNRNGY